MTGVGGLSPLVRLAAGAIALVAWIGLGVQFAASLHLTGSAGAAVWVLLRYFTVLANLGLAVTLTGVALGWRRLWEPAVQGGVAVAMLLVGVVYGLLLRGLVELSGGAALADLLLHHVVPILSGLFWLALAPKAGLRWRDPFIWALFPIAYLAYALARGGIEGIYAYPFINVARIGWAMTLLNAAVIAVGFLLAGLAMVGLGRGPGLVATRRTTGPGRRRP